MKQTIWTHYELRHGHSETLPCEGWSQYRKRSKMFDRKEITEEEIYGLEQVKEHAKEIRSTQGEYAESWAKAELSIIRLTTITDYFGPV